MWLGHMNFAQISVLNYSLEKVTLVAESQSHSADMIVHSKNTILS